MQPQRKRVSILRGLSALVLMATTYGQSQEVGTVTLLKDTPLEIIRGYSVFQGSEGVRLRPGDVLKTGPAATARVQLEFSRGAIVDLGPSSQAYLFSQSGGAAEIVLLCCWLKGETTSGNYHYPGSLAVATTEGGNVLLHNNENATEVFVERGAAAVNSGGVASIASSKDRIFSRAVPVNPSSRPTALPRNSSDSCLLAFTMRCRRVYRASRARRAALSSSENAKSPMRILRNCCGFLRHHAPPIAAQVHQNSDTRSRRHLLSEPQFSCFRYDRLVSDKTNVKS